MAVGAGSAGVGRVGFRQFAFNALTGSTRAARRPGTRRDNHNGKDRDGHGGEGRGVRRAYLVGREIGLEPSRIVVAPVAPGRDRDVERQDILGFEAVLDLARLPEALGHDRGADQERERDGDLSVKWRPRVGSTPSGGRTLVVVATRGSAPASRCR